LCEEEIDMATRNILNPHKWRQMRQAETRQAVLSTNAGQKAVWGTPSANEAHSGSYAAAKAIDRIAARVALRTVVQAK
jgi:hypothetical protein